MFRGCRSISIAIERSDEKSPKIYGMRILNVTKGISLARPRVELVVLAGLRLYL